MRKNRFLQWLEFIIGALFALSGIVMFIRLPATFPVFNVFWSLITLLSGIDAFVNHHAVERPAGHRLSMSLAHGMMSTLFFVRLLLGAMFGWQGFDSSLFIWLFSFCAYALSRQRHVLFLGGKLAWRLTFATAILWIIIGPIMMLILLVIRHGLWSIPTDILLYPLGIYFILQGAGNIATIVLCLKRGR